MANIQPVHSPCYCINYRRAANTLTKYYDAAFAPIGLTGNQFFLLNSIQQLGSCNKSELAQYTSLDRTTIIRNLDTLLKKELVEPAPGANRRNSAIQLSENGRNAFTSGRVSGKPFRIRYSRCWERAICHPMGSVPPH